VAYPSLSLVSLPGFALVDRLAEGQRVVVLGYGTVAYRGGSAEWKSLVSRSVSTSLGSRLRCFTE
jgi:hypothetical protein